jgi:5-methylcytosine-specific restriction endonuclease McrA
VTLPRQVLQEPCLVLNRNWQAITFLPVQSAIVTVLRDMASVLDVEDYLLLSFDEWVELARDTGGTIRTPSRTIAAPEVIVLKKYGERPPRRVVFNRPNLYQRDAFTCQYCGVALPATSLTIEHVLPRSRGGPTSWENCVAACESCNARKADRTPQEAGMKLRKRPAQPRWSLELRVPAATRAAWEPFLAKELGTA